MTQRCLAGPGNRIPQTVLFPTYEFLEYIFNKETCFVAI
jgi:hypothetical protein